MTMTENKKLLGRSEGDSALLFPVHTHASSPCVKELQVNGKNVQIWDYTQLECLTTQVLHHMTITKCSACVACHHERVEDGFGVA